MEVDGMRWNGAAGRRVDNYLKGWSSEVGLTDGRLTATLVGKERD